MRRRGNGIIDRYALGQIGKIILFKTKFTVEVHYKFNGFITGVVELDQLFEFTHQAGECMFFIELTGTMEGEVGGLGHRDCHNTG